MTTTDTASTDKETETIHCDYTDVTAPIHTNIKKN